MIQPTTSVEGNLSSEQFDQVFSDWLESASISICKIEKLQEFEISSEDIGFDAFRRGDSETCETEIRKLFESQLDFYTQMNRHGVVFERIRLVKRPLTGYLKYEFVTYKMGARYGEKILIADVTDDQFARLYTATEDCLIFDSRRVLVNKYDVAGKWTNGIAVEDPKRVEQFIELLAKLRAIGVPLGHYEVLQSAELESVRKM